MPKNRLRQSMLSHRRELCHEIRHATGLAAQHNLIDTVEFREASVIALYSPIHGEVATGAIYTEAIHRGKCLLYPAVSGQGLVFCRVRSMADLVPGAFGIPEPVTGLEEVDCSSAELIVVPGVAFDLSGRRVGYGKGFYDRSLHMLEGQGRLAGLCYDFQLVPEIMGEPHDVMLDLVITDTRVHRPRDYHKEGEEQQS